jgi:hypothetical protein
MVSFYGWTESSVISFQTLKSTLLSKPVLITASFYLPFIGQTDAGNKAIRAVLSQDISDVEHPIAFLSKFSRNENVYIYILVFSDNLHQVKVKRLEVNKA